jgi:hypothetical protein
MNHIAIASLPGGEAALYAEKTKKRKNESSIKQTTLM